MNHTTAGLAPLLRDSLSFCPLFVFFFGLLLGVTILLLEQADQLIELNLIRLAAPVYDGAPGSVARRPSIAFSYSVGEI